MFDDDITLIKEIGIGMFNQVYLASKKRENILYVVKSIINLILWKVKKLKNIYLMK